MAKRILIFLLLMFIGIQLNATTYYIAPSGSDANSGSYYSPWKSLSHASSNAKVFGDIIYVQSGTYYETESSRLSLGVRIKGEGISSVITTTTLTQPIIILESPVGTIGNNIISDIKIDGGSISHSGIYINGRTGVEVFNCTFSNFAEIFGLLDDGVYAIFGENTADIEIHHSTVQGTIHLFYVENVDIHHCIIGYPVMNVNFRDGVYACDVDNFTVRNCYFKNLATQIIISSYPNTKLQNIFIFNNIMYNIGVASNEWYGSGIDLGGVTDEIARNIIIANNTMVANPKNRQTRIGIYLPMVGYATDIAIQNNIMTGFRYATIFAAGPDRVIDVISIENNIFWDNTSNPAMTYATSDSAYFTNVDLPLSERNYYIFSDPQFVGEDDFHLKEFSPAVGGGIYIPSIIDDYEDNQRTDIFDIGAYGYGLTTEIIEGEEMGFLVYPIPFYDQFTLAIDNPNFNTLRISICDIQGKIVYEDRITEPISTIYMEDAFSGLYILTVMREDGTIISTMKIIKN